MERPLTEWADGLGLSRLRGWLLVLLATLALGLAGCLADDADPPGLDDDAPDDGGNGEDEPDAFVVSGEVSGLDGEPVILVLNDDLETLEIDEEGEFAFETELEEGEEYTVAIEEGPEGQACETENATGTIPDSEVDDVIVECTDFEASAFNRFGQMHLEWEGPEMVDVTWSSDPDCDWDNYSVCDDAERLSEQTEEELILGPEDGIVAHTPSYFVLDAGGHRIGPLAAGPMSPSFDDYVEDSKVVDDRLYIAGQFDEAGVMNRGLTLHRAEDGEYTGHMPDVDGEIYAIAPDGEGGYFVGGDFDEIDGIERENLAHLYPGGAVNEDWDGSADDDVLALEAVGDTLFVGGEFGELSGISRDYLGAVDAHSGAYQAWDLGRFADDYIYAFATDGEYLYVGGDDEIAPHPTDPGEEDKLEYAAAFDLETLEVADWMPEPDRRVYALAVDGDYVYLGGRFSDLGSLNQDHIGRVSVESGTPDVSWTPEVDDDVYALAMGDDLIFAGGEFEEDEGDAEYVAGFDLQDGDLSAEWVDPELDDEVYALAWYGDRLYVGGEFEEVDDVEQEGLAVLSANGEHLQDFHFHLDDEVHALTTYEGTLLVGGEFEFSWQERPYIAALDLETGTFVDGLPEPDDDVYALAHDSDRLYLGGDFEDFPDEVDGERAHMAAIDRDTDELDPDFRDDDLDDEVEDMIFDEDRGLLFVVGQFDDPQKSAVAYDSAGDPTSSWDPGFVHGVSTRDMTVAIHDDVLYVGGRFDELDEYTSANREYLAAWDTDDLSEDGLLDWEPDPDDRPLAIVANDDAVYVGGRFDDIGGGSSEYLAALHPPAHEDEGELIPAWEGRVDDDRVTALHRTDDVLYVGGRFSDTDSVSDDSGSYDRERLVAFDANDGTVDQEWDPEAIDRTYVMKSFEDSILLGGRFYYMNGIGRHKFAMVDPETGELVW